MIKKKRFDLYLTCILLSISAVLFSMVFSLTAFIKITDESGGPYGTIGLRSYFHCGIGTKEEPFVITRPKHLKNLSSLQSLGVFDTPMYFQLGYDLDGTKLNKFYKDDNTSTEVVDALDMNNTSINSIGNESTPFYGIFEGNGLEIQNLTVKASPEDAGLFGYVASKGKVQNLFLDNIIVDAPGYSSAFESLYGDSESTALKEQSSFQLAVDGTDVPEAKLSGQDVNKTYEIALDTSKKYQFSFDMGIASSAFDYSLVFSDVFVDVASDKQTAEVDMTSDESIFKFFDNIEKDPTASKQYPLVATSSLSIVASSIDADGISHSKVVNSMLVSFQKDKSGNEGDNAKIKMILKLKEKDHGNNVGFLIGHCDGSCIDCYVHDGTLKLNNGDVTKVKNTSTHGLIGLVGDTVDDQAYSHAGSGAVSGKETGVLDFTGIYHQIVDDDTSFGKNGDFYQYKPKTESEGNQYYKYLRYETSPSDEIRYTKKEKRLSLIGQTVIQDEPDANRGLGVFKVGTDYSTNGIGQNKGSSWDSSMISKTNEYSDSNNPTLVDSTKKENDKKYIYYTTGEIQNTDVNSHAWRCSVSFDDFIDGEINGNTFSRQFLMGTTLPKEVTKEALSTYEKEKNYLFRFELKSDSEQRNFYFSNVANDENDTLSYPSDGGEFLSKYFEYKLIDENGEAITAGDPRCGVMIKDKSGKNITSLDASFRLNTLIEKDGNNKYTSPKPMYIINTEEFTNGIKNQTADVKSSNNYIVANTINFEITNERGANITVLASSREYSRDAPDGWGSILGVYKLPDYVKKNGTYYVPCDQSKKEKNWTTPDYGMLLTCNNMLDYYDVSSDGHIGYYDTTNNFHDTSDNQDVKGIKDAQYDTKHNGQGYDRIYAHTFKLEKGRYCLGTAYGDCTVYYVCANGQNDGDLAFSSNVNSQINKIENIDFTKVSRSQIEVAVDVKKIKQNQALRDQRLFVLFNPNNISTFNNSYPSVLEFKYETNRLNITGNNRGVDKLTILSYRKTEYIDETVDVGDRTKYSENSTVNIFGKISSNANTLIYKP